MWEILLLLLGILLILGAMLRERYKYFKKRGIPYKEPVFLLGSMPRSILLLEGFPDALARVYKETPAAPVVGMFHFHLPILLIKDPHLLQRVLIKDFSSFHDRGIPIDVDSNPLLGHLFMMSGTKWRALRNKLTPTFTSGKLKGMLPLMDTIVDQLIDVLDKQDGQEIDMKDAYARLTADIIGSCSFGMDSGCIKNPDSDFRRLMNKSLKPGILDLIKGIVAQGFPALAKKLKISVISKDISDYFIGITKHSIDHRIKTGEKRNDFLQLLVELKLKGEVETSPEELKDTDDKYLYHEVSSHLLKDTGKLEINDGLLAAQAFVFLAAGLESTAITLSLVTYLLSKHQDVQEKLRQEVREMVAKHGGFTYQALKAMPYLSACIDEGLRLYNPIGLLFRKCNSDIILDDGTKIEKGMQLLISTSAIMNDETYFPYPEEFRPERFLEGDPFPGSFLPFGDGPRVCIAQRFAQLEVKLALAKMIDRYRIETCPKMAAHEPIKMDPKSVFPQPLGGIHCRLRHLHTK